MYAPYVMEYLFLISFGHDWEGSETIMSIFVVATSLINSYL